MAKSGAPLDLSGFSSWEVREKALLGLKKTTIDLGIGIGRSRSIKICSTSSWNEMWRVRTDAAYGISSHLKIDFFRTLEERAKRLFSTKDKLVEDLDPSLFMKDADKTKRGKYVSHSLCID